MRRASITLAFVLSVLAAVPVSGGTDWPSVQTTRWETAKVRPEKVHFVEAIAAQIRRSQARYDTVALKSHVPWDVIAVIHNMECSLSFQQNLAQGDSIFYKSRHVPKNRPPGEPPFTWEYCAIDALHFDHLDRKYWNEVGWKLQNIEAYNGTGYQRFHPDVPTPYLWSWSTVYSRGKYVADGQWSSTAISQQCGVVPILKALETPP